MTDFHASYYAHKLILKNNSTSTEKLVRAIMNSEIDLLPHQIEAALFFSASPLSEGVLIADEVGLGKTIEAGLILRQYWNEGKRKILIIAPASLRKQWGEELRSKFFIDSIIFDTDTYKSELSKGNKKPLEQEDKIIICSYHFAANYKKDISNADFDLAVLDEAHKIRNSWRETGAKTSKAIREALFGTKKLLLTATPLHNSMKDLVGILQFIDDSLDASQWKDKKNDNDLSLSEDDYSYLEARVEKICNRTLRADVTEYINYTNREVLLHEYESNDSEKELYNRVFTFFSNDDSVLYNKKAKNLLQIAALKLLSSSPKAVSSFLGTLLANHKKKTSNVDLSQFIDVEDDEALLPDSTTILTGDESESEILKLDEIKTLADSIEDSKLDILADALETGFKEQEKLGADKKVIIFTESVQTQFYVKAFLESIGYKDKIVIFNGSNDSEDSIKIYNNWKERHKGTNIVSGIRSVDMKQSLIHYFKESAEIMIATESGGEGVNLQFCNMIVNYDLPWNPQRIEQRIGRCHRYGQKYDVLIINFLNRSNKADRRVYELLDEKFRLFDGIFGSSNEILGAIESGVDIEQKIHQIYTNSTDEKDMEEKFEKLDRELETQIHTEQKSAQYKLLDNLSSGKQIQLRERENEITSIAEAYNNMLWHLSVHSLRELGKIRDKDNKIIELHTAPEKNIPTGLYSVHNLEDENIRIIRENTPLGQYIFSKALTHTITPKKIIFEYNGELDEVIGTTGFMKCSILRTRGFEDSEHIILSAIDDDLEPLDQKTAQAIFEMPVIHIEDTSISKASTIDLEDIEDDIVCAILDEASHRNNTYIQDEERRLKHIFNGNIEVIKAEAEENMEKIRKKSRNVWEKIKVAEKKRDTIIEEQRTKMKEMLIQLRKELNKPYEKKDIFILEWHLQA